MNRILLPLLLVIPAMLFAQSVSYTALPKKFQLYPRDARDSAAVVVSGSVSTAGYDSAVVTVYKNGTAYKRQSQTLAYISNSAPFAISVSIHAELANYKFEFRVNSTLLATADSVVCGDAYMINGQSNATGWTSWSYTNPWVRSFGTEAPGSDAGNVGLIQGDTVWGIGQCQTWNQPPQNGHLAVGVWGMQVGRKIVETHGIPVCVLNGGTGTTNLAMHQRNVAIASLYGCMLYRITKAGLKNTLKAIFWYQGENDAGDSLTSTRYRTNFYTLNASWRADYPGALHTYLFQLRPGNCPDPYSGIVGEQQRQIPEGHPDIVTMSTASAPGHTGCHYDATGYQELGNRLYRLLARDFYKSTDTVNINAPNILSAVFSDANHTQLVLQFNQPVLLPADATMKNFFALDGAWSAVSSLAADTAKRTVTLVLPATSSAKKVTYVPTGLRTSGTGNPFEGPWLTNPRGIGALTFCDFPITTTGTKWVGRAQPSIAGGALGYSPRSMVLGSDGAVVAPTGHVKAIALYAINGTLIGIRSVGTDGRIRIGVIGEQLVVVRANQARQ